MYPTYSSFTKATSGSEVQESGIFHFEESLSQSTRLSLVQFGRKIEKKNSEFQEIGYKIQRICREAENHSILASEMFSLETLVNYSADPYGRS